MGVALCTVLLGGAIPALGYKAPGAECVRAFADPQVPNLFDIVMIDLGNVSFFHLQYGAAQDCPSGCFNSSAIGLMWSCDEVRWLGLTDYDGVEIVREHYVTEAQLAGLELEASVAERMPYYKESLRRALAGLAAGSPSVTCEGTACRARLDARLVKAGAHGLEDLLSLHPLDRGLYQLALASLDDEAGALALWRTARGRWHDISYPDCAVPARCVEKADALVRVGKPGLARSRYEDACSRKDPQACASLAALLRSNGDKQTAWYYVESACRNGHVTSCVEVAGRARARGDNWHAAFLLGDACIAGHEQACTTWRDVGRQLCEQKDGSWCRGLVKRFEGKSERLDTAHLREVLGIREGATPAK